MARAEKQNTSQSYKDVERDIKSGVFSTVKVVLFFGSEPLLVETYEKRLREAFVAPEAAFFDAVKVDGDAFDVDDVICACDTLPMMSERRVVTVHGMHGDERTLGGAGAKRLAEYVNSLPASTLLIITATAFSKRSALYKALQGQGKAYEFGRLERADAKSFIAGRFRRAGQNPEAAAVDELLSVSGYLERDAEGDLFLLDGMVGTVSAYAKASGTNTVSVSDVRVCLGSSAESDVFLLLDSVSTGDKGKALEIANAIASKNESAFRLLSLLTGQFEIMLGCVELRDKGMSSSAMAKALGVKSEYRLRKAAGFAKRYSEKRLLDLLHRLYRVDSDIKSGIYDENLALTMFIAEM